MYTGQTLGLGTTLEVSSPVYWVFKKWEIGLPVYIFGQNSEFNDNAESASLTMAEKLELGEYSKVQDLNFK